MVTKKRDKYNEYELLPQQNSQHTTYHKNFEATNHSYSNLWPQNITYYSKCKWQR